MVYPRERSGSPGSPGSLHGNECEELQHAVDSDALVGARGGPAVSPGFSTDLINILDFKSACKRAVEELIIFLERIELPTEAPDLSVSDLRIPSVEEQVEESLRRELEQHSTIEPRSRSGILPTPAHKPPCAEDEVPGSSALAGNGPAKDRGLSDCDDAGLQGNGESLQDGPEVSMLRQRAAGKPSEIPSSSENPCMFDENEQLLNDCQDGGKDIPMEHILGDKQSLECPAEADQHLVDGMQWNGVSPEQTVNDHDGSECHLQGCEGLGREREPVPAALPGAQELAFASDGNSRPGCDLVTGQGRVQCDSELDGGKQQPLLSSAKGFQSDCVMSEVGEVDKRCELPGDGPELKQNMSHKTLPVDVEGSTPPEGDWRCKTMLLDGEGQGFLDTVKHDQQMPVAGQGTEGYGQNEEVNPCHFRNDCAMSEDGNVDKSSDRPGDTDEPEQDRSRKTMSSDGKGQGILDAIEHGVAKLVPPAGRAADRCTLPDLGRGCVMVGESKKEKQSDQPGDGARPGQDRSERNMLSNGEDQGILHAFDHGSIKHVPVAGHRRGRHSVSEEAEPHGSLGSSLPRQPGSEGFMLPPALCQPLPLPSVLPAERSCDLGLHDTSARGSVSHSPSVMNSGSNVQRNEGMTSTPSSPVPQSPLEPPLMVNVDTQVEHLGGEPSSGGVMATEDEESEAVKKATRNRRRGKERQGMSNPARMRGQKGRQRRKGVLPGGEQSPGEKMPNECHGPTPAIRKKTRKRKLDKGEQSPGEKMPNECDRPTPATRKKTRKRKLENECEDTPEQTQARAKTDQPRRKGHLPERLKHMISLVVGREGSGDDAVRREAMVTRIREKRDAMKKESSLHCLKECKELPPPGVKIGSRATYLETGGRGTALAGDNGGGSSADCRSTQQQELGGDVSAWEVVLRVALYHHEKRNMKTQEFEVLGTQFLTQLRDRFSCVSDKIAKDHGIDAPSGFICVENVFYNDLRRADAIDYSADIMRRLLSNAERSNRKGTDPSRRVSKQACRVGGSGEGSSGHLKGLDGSRRAGKQPYRCDEVGEGSLEQPKSGPYTRSRMDHTRFEDLTIRIGHPYVYCHQGNCYHRMQFLDLRLIHDTDVRCAGKYPLLQYQPRMRKRKCTICEVYHASRVTYADKLAPTTPCFFCDQCFFLLHYDEDGVLVYDDFEAYPYYAD